MIAALRTPHSSSLNRPEADRPERRTARHMAPFFGASLLAWIAVPIGSSMHWGIYAASVGMATLAGVLGHRAAGRSPGEGAGGDSLAGLPAGDRAAARLRRRHQLGRRHAGAAAGVLHRPLQQPCPAVHGPGRDDDGAARAEPADRTARLPEQPVPRRRDLHRRQCDHRPGHPATGHAGSAAGRRRAPPRADARADRRGRAQPLAQLARPRRGVRSGEDDQQREHGDPRTSPRTPPACCARPRWRG